MAEGRDDEKRLKDDWHDPETERRLERQGRRQAGLEHARPEKDSDEPKRSKGHTHPELLGLHDLDDLSDLKEQFREHRRQRMDRGPKAEGAGSEAGEHGESPPHS